MKIFKKNRINNINFSNNNHNIKIKIMILSLNRIYKLKIRNKTNSRTIREETEIIKKQQMKMMMSKRIIKSFLEKRN